MLDTFDAYEDLLIRYERWMKMVRGNSNKTIEKMLSLTKKFLLWLTERGTDISNVNQEQVDDYILYCKKKYSPNTMVPITANLRKLLVYCLELNIVVRIARMKPPERDKTPFTKAEVKDMFDASKDNPLHHAILKVLYYTGMRESELRSLDIEDIDFARLQITIKHGKGDRQRTVNITPDCAHAIQEWLRYRPKAKTGHEQALFLSTHRQRISRTVVVNIVKTTAVKSGITKHAYPHKFRITMITHMAENGCGIKEIQPQSGHHNIETLMGYIVHSAERIRDVYDKTFGDVDGTTVTPHTELDTEEYKKRAIDKYLKGELDVTTLTTVLKTYDHDDKPHRRPSDVAYG
ncbi:MAG: tyrosine-type recombinase/integrase [Candidatus Thermoplasmatota archaeon]|nr:tyrosine-type recombinase/integrase [Candidatus Thermoplasmatota archaeon]MDD5778052.1 tyrosine-type recombinase/integrase [Candidatus Thermoplasmatota archaeon]